MCGESLALNSFLTTTQLIILTGYLLLPCQKEFTQLQSCISFPLTSAKFHPSQAWEFNLPYEMLPTKAEGDIFPRDDGSFQNSTYQNCQSLLCRQPKYLAMYYSWEQ